MEVVVNGVSRLHRCKEIFFLERGEGYRRRSEEPSRPPEIGCWLCAAGEVTVLLTSGNDSRKLEYNSSVGFCKFFLCQVSDEEHFSHGVQTLPKNLVLDNLSHGWQKKWWLHAD